MSIQPAKFGPWGGSRRGEIRDGPVAPYRLLRLTIWMNPIRDFLHGISFSYIGIDGLTYHVDPSDFVGENKKHVIQLGLMDYVKEISGITDGSWVRSLKITTLKGTYGPYGDRVFAGVPFSFSVQGSQRIVGFFVRTALYVQNAGSYISAIGVYARHC